MYIRTKNNFGEVICILMETQDSELIDKIEAYIC